MLMVGVVAWFVGFILIICYPINKRKNARCSAQTQGVLSKIRRRHNSDGDLKDMHIYSYRVDGVEYELRTLDHSMEASRVGDECTIWYNPRKPQDAQAFRGSDAYLKNLLIIGVVLFLLGFLLTCFGFVRSFIL